MSRIASETKLHSIAENIEAAIELFYLSTARTALHHRRAFR